MTVTLDLPPDIETRVQEEAARRSLPVEEYLLWLVTGAMLPEEEAERRRRTLERLRSAGDIGDEEEQRETFSYLKAAVEADRLSERPRFA